MNTTPDSTQGLHIVPSGTPVRQGRRHIRWNAGGWLGCVLGCTIWMVVGVFAVAPVGPLLSVGLFGLFLLATGIGLQLYRRRESLAILRAMQLYMLALLAISLSYLALATSAGALDLLERTWSYPVPVSAWAIPGCYLICLLLASYLDWSRRNKPVS